MRHCNSTNARSALWRLPLVVREHAASWPGVDVGVFDFGVMRWFIRWMETERGYGGVTSCLCTRGKWVHGQEWHTPTPEELNSREHNTILFSRSRCRRTVSAWSWTGVLTAATTTTTTTITISTTINTTRYKLTPFCYCYYQYVCRANANLVRYYNSSRSDV